MMGTFSVNDKETDKKEMNCLDIRDFDLVAFHSIDGYQHCDDGFAAAYAIWSHIQDEIQYYPATYDMSPNMEQFKGKNVLFVDCSYKRPIMEQLEKICAKIVVLEHHPSAKKELGDKAYFYYTSEHSGCVLTWHTFFAEEPVPLLLRYIEENDIWQFKTEGVQQILAKLRSLPQDFNVWKDFEISLTNPKIWQSYHEQGLAILENRKRITQQLLKTAHWLEIGGYRIRAVNCSMAFVAPVANALLNYNHFGCAYFINHAGRVLFNLRSREDKIDVGELARGLGGGGHRNASGFDKDIHYLAHAIQLTVPPQRNKQTKRLS